MAYVAQNVLAEALLEMNRWHQTTPLLLLFSKQSPGEGGQVSGSTEAVRSAFDLLFALERIGISDDARKYHLHVCHGKDVDYPHALRRPTDDYGKAYQRTIKDSFANNGFLERLESGKYRLVSADFKERVFRLLRTEKPIDLRPLVLFYLWDKVAPGKTYRELWCDFDRVFHVTAKPFDQIFTCSQLDDVVPLDPSDEGYNVKGIFLPHEFGSGKIDIEFWKRFRTELESRLESLKWKGQIAPLAAEITSALMHDQSAFLLGLPGTGKTTIVTEAVLPALRAANGTQNELRFVQHTLTPSTTQADLFGFQGLDGNWVEGPLTQELLVPYSTANGESAEASVGEDVANEHPELDVPRLVFFDEANRVDIEGLLSPLQTSLDRMQKRLEPSVVYLGKTEYVLPRRVWRIFAGNSPATDIGRKEQSRPWKRRISVVVPPDPIKEVVGSAASFRAMCLDLLTRAGRSTEVEVSEPALTLLGSFKANSEHLEDLRVILDQIRLLPQVAITVGLVESILLRAATHKALNRESPLDSALTQSLQGLIAGPAETVRQIVELARVRSFSRFAGALEENVLSTRAGTLAFELDPIL